MSEPIWSEEHLGRPASDARDGHALADRWFERAQALLDLCADRFDEPVEVRKVSQLGAQDEALVGSEAAIEGSLELCPLGPESSTCQRCKRRWVRLARHDGGEHRLRGKTVDRRCHGSELDVRPFKHLGDPVQLIGPLPHE